MKTFKKRVLVVVFMLGTLFNYANNDKDFNTKVDAKKVKIVFKNVKKGNLLIIKDKNGVQLHSELISKYGKLIKTFDFSKLNNGKYTVELNKDFEILINTIEVLNNKVIFNKSSEKKIFKPVIRTKENVLMISKISFDEKPTRIVLFYNNKEVYKEIVNSNTILNRAYKLSKEIKGDYKVIVYNNKKSYIKNFKI